MSFEIKAKYKVNEKVRISHNYIMSPEGLPIMIIDPDNTDEDNLGCVEKIFIEATRFEKLDKRHQFDKKIPMYYIATTYIIKYKVKGKIYEEDSLYSLK